jgi:hypothetical protein
LAVEVGVLVEAVQPDGAEGDEGGGVAAVAPDLADPVEAVQELTGRASGPRVRPL